ncbi:MAG TPA: hypothetical protein VEX70_13570 [Pyrinomonadaceae bacterium]|nr:hypothetical protein [Pyrinomonadaceae bacterium]
MLSSGRVAGDATHSVEVKRIAAWWGTAVEVRSALNPAWCVTAR